MTQQSAADLISLPQGGGALAGIGETFQPDLHTGTGNLSVPLPLPAGRNGLQPSLTLSYSTGNPNGPFGLGWDLSVPGVRRRTSKAIPRYQDDTDVFVLSGAEYLVPVPTADGSARYRPQTEAGYARITHVTGDAGDYWEVWSRDGLRSHYGTPRPTDTGVGVGWSDPAVVTGPRGQIFGWLLSETVDPMGNRIDYRYLPDPHTTAQRYLAEVRYADYGDPTDPQYLISVRFSYQDRPDPFSDRRPGFELRTTQRGMRIEIWTQADIPRLATSIELSYTDRLGAPASSGVSLLSTVTITGHDGTERQQLPPMEFGYIDWVPGQRRFQPLTGDLPATSLSAPGLDLVDLFGDGTPDILQLNGIARYWRNHGGGHFDPPRNLAFAPAGAALGAPGVQLADLDGDGRPDLLVSTPTRTGFWPLAAPSADRSDSQAGFDPAGYVSARSVPTFSLSDPQVRLVDLDGDGRMDLLRTGQKLQLAYNDGQGGFTDLHTLDRGTGLPDVSFTDPRVRLADMTGDGLTDIVLVHDRDICYWPNLGYGQWGPRVVMSHPPQFADGRQYDSTGFDPRRLLLGDVVGDGCADVVYVGDGHVTVWVNQSGNGFADPVIVTGTPRVSDASAIRLADILGAGVAGVLWTAGTGTPRTRYAVLDLTGGVKPYLLHVVDNHAGARTTIDYATSTDYAAADRAAGRPWRTTLPFPVQVVSRATVTDYHSDTTLTSSYAYHEGYWDPGDREFRGFARVDHTDTLAAAAPAPVDTWVDELDPLAPRRPLPNGLDASTQGNLVTNWSFDDPAPAVGIPGWAVLSGDSGSATTAELAPSTLPYGASGSMAHIVAAGAGGGLTQTLAVPSTVGCRVVASVWVYVTSGTAALSVRAPGATGPAGPAAALSTATQRWQLLRIACPATPTAASVTLSAVGGPADFDADHTWVFYDTGPGDPRSSPATRTTTWFHQGPVGRPTGAWTELDPSGEYWPGDPPMTAAVDLSLLPAALPRPAMREAIRGLRGRVLRTELYAHDGTPRADLPYEVHENTYQLAPVLDGRTTSDPGWQTQPVVTVRPVLTRDTVWDRGTDPMTRLQLTGDYDDYGRAHTAVTVSVPRARALDATGSPCLATLTSTEYATRDDTDLYLLDRVSRTDRHECLDDGTTPVLTFAAAALAGTRTGDLRALELTYYDGAPFTGLDFGQLGNHGLPVRTEHLVLTPALLTEVCQPGPGALGTSIPPYLAVDGSPPPATWPADYPDAFRHAVQDAPAARGPQLGYRWHPDGGGYTAGYYAQTRRLHYDVQVPPGTPTPGPAARGLVLTSRDAYSGDTTTSYDPYDLLPVTVTDPAGLVRTAAYDYRVLKPSLTIDENGNRTQVGYTPLGLVGSLARLGKDGVNEGDTPGQPGTTYGYDLTAWDDSAPPPGTPNTPRRPMSVTTTRRIEHRWTLVDQENARRAAAGQPPLTDAEITAMFGPDEPTAHPERFIHTVEYSDGFARLLQTRTQSDDFVVDDPGLTLDPATRATPVAGHLAAPDAPAVVVSGWSVYDNKGCPIISYEPFLDTGYDYTPPTAHRLAALARITRHYDPRGILTRTINPDNSEHRIVPGVPASLTKPDDYTPTPWETYTYDPNDNAGRTHPTISLEYLSHWNTPASTLADALGRTVASTERTDTATLVTAQRYDIDGNLLAINDPLGRVCADTVYDQAGQPWRTWLLDAGTTHTIRDTTGAPVEQHDDKGATTLTAFDLAHRPIHTWAADRTGQAATLRNITVYGDNPTDSALTENQAKTINALGRIVVTLDEAGQVTTSGYDLDGNPLGTSRRILHPDLLLSTLPAPGPGGRWDDTSYPVDWQPTGTDTPATHAESLLDPTTFQTDARYDALGRTTTATGPLDATGTRNRLDYTYGRGGGITTITLNGTPYLRTVAYDSHGRRQLTHLGNGILVRYLYHPQTLRLARLHATHAVQPTATSWQGDGPVLQDYSYRNDLAGNLLTLSDRTPNSGILPNRDALDRQFVYDPLYRLVSATGRETDTLPQQPWLDNPRSQDVTRARPYAESYGYDPVGNLSSLRHSTDTAGTGAYTRTFTPFEGGNRVATLGVGTLTIGYTHDPCGNLTSETTSRLFEWDHANRLATFREQASAAEPSVFTQYCYDASGTRVIKLVRNQNGPNIITIYLGGGFERLLRTTVTVGKSVTTTHDTLHIADGASRLALTRRGDPLPDDPMPRTLYHLSDHLGSSTAVTDPAGVLLNREEYAPYAETSFGSYLHKRYRFITKERDEETGLYYHGARYYAPWLARWAGCDPAKASHTSSPYAYAANNPMCYVDRDGREEAPTQVDPPVHATEIPDAGAAHIGMTKDHTQTIYFDDPPTKFEASGVTIHGGPAEGPALGPDTSPASSPIGSPGSESAVQSAATPPARWDPEILLWGSAEVKRELPMKIGGNAGVKVEGSLETVGIIGVRDAGPYRASVVAGGGGAEIGWKRLGGHREAYGAVYGGKETVHQTVFGPGSVTHTTESERIILVEGGYGPFVAGAYQTGTTGTATGTGIYLGARIGRFSGGFGFNLDLLKFMIGPLLDPKGNPWYDLPMAPPR